MPPGSALEAIAPVVAPPPPALVVEARPSIPRGEPSGRFFEPKDVDQSPKVATRVEPKLPDNLPAVFREDVVVLRVLVSQTGHPFQIGVLRRSTVGRELDDAVIAAVRQWTFSPARKRGEAVSCWYNVGVPLSRVN